MEKICVAKKGLGSVSQTNKGLSRGKNTFEQQNPGIFSWEQIFLFLENDFSFFPHMRHFLTYFITSIFALYSLYDNSEATSFGR